MRVKPEAAARVGNSRPQRYFLFFFFYSPLALLNNVVSIDASLTSHHIPILLPIGHVQVILPHLTESYNSQRDPGEAGIPYCTLKSFPSNIDHCIQWSRDKFESNFNLKPALVAKFLADHQQSLDADLQLLKTNENIVLDGFLQFVKVIRSFSCTAEEILLLGR